MKNILNIMVVAAGIFLLGTGCALDIAGMPVDSTSIDNPKVKQIQAALQESSNTWPRLVIVPQNTNSRSSGHETLFGTYLDTEFAELPGFVVVPRAELSALNAENALQTLSGNTSTGVKVNKADYLISYQFVSANRTSKTKQVYEHSGRGQGYYRDVAYYSNNVKGRVSVIHIATGERAYTRIFEATLPTGTTQSESWDRAMELLTKKIVKDFYERYGLPVYVAETRGNGRVALLSDNYLTRNLLKGTGVSFDGNATGKVYEGRWVEVDNYKNAGVCKNKLCTIAMPEAKSDQD